MSKIRALDTRQQCREKLPVFFGSRDNYLHGVREVIANACDEISNNFETGQVTVTLDTDNTTITIKDSGRGMPIEEVTDGVKNYVLLFETLFASTNYDNVLTGKKTTGQNGVGLTVLNYTSKKFIVEVGRNGKIYRISYKNGGELQSFEEVGTTKEHYSQVTFELDETVYTKNVFDINDIKYIVKSTSGISNDIEFTVIYGEEVEHYHYDTVLDYFNDITTKLTAFNLNATYELDNEHLQYIEIALNTSVEPTQQTFLNRTLLVKGGTIHEGIISGTRAFMNKVLKENKKYQKIAKAVTLDDIRGSISFVVDTLSTNPEYSNQTKFSTEKIQYKTIAHNMVNDLLNKVYNSKPKSLEAFINHILTVAKFNEDSGKTRARLQKKLNENIEKPTGRVAKFMDCKIHGKDSEIYIAEGLSALGSIVFARDADYQACYPLTGKILNCLKADFDVIFKNEVITDLIKVLGCGTVYKDLFDINNLRFGKIIIATDQDYDGFDIQTLALTMFYRLMPELITGGYIYIANTPLYEVRLKDDSVLYWYSEEQKKLEEPKYNNIVSISRAKGLGELDAEVMAETAMNKKTRKLTQVTVDMLDLDKMYNAFDLWMNTEVEPRKNYIEENLNKKYEYSDMEIVEELPVDELITDAKMNYSKYIIEERFLCDYRDGFKPVHRRILWSMKQNNVVSLTKCHTVAGAVMEYHPHGDCYDTIVNLTQKDKQLIPVIIGKGNFGQNTSRDIQYAHARYTECKLSDIAKDMLKDCNKHMVDMVPNYDGTVTIPEVLPVRFPAILTYANSGIGVGMSSTSASFNLKELCDVIITYLKTGERNALFPDFATGGYLVVDTDAIRDINTIGTGTVTLKGKYTVEDNVIRITEIPYGKTREAIIDKIIKLIESGKLPEIDMVKDLTGLKGMCIEITVKKSKRNLIPRIIHDLYEQTPLKSTFAVNMRMLVDGLPKVIGVWEVIERWLDWRRQCLCRGMEYEINKLEDKLNVLFGLLKVTEVIDEVIDCIKNSTEAGVIRNLMKRFNLNERQAEYIANMKLRNLNKEYIKNNTKEIKSTENKVNEIRSIIESEDQVNGLIINDMIDVKEKFGIDRRTLFIK